MGGSGSEELGNALPLQLQSCDSWIVVKENPDRKKNTSHYERVEKQFTCWGENTEKHINFTVPIGKEVTRIDKNGDEVTINISYILQFRDSVRFIASSFLNFIINLSEVIHKT